MNVLQNRLDVLLQYMKQEENEAPIVLKQLLLMKYSKDNFRFIRQFHGRIGKRFPHLWAIIIVLDHFW